MKVLYSGPSGAVNRDVGRHTGQGDRMVPGREYDVPADLAHRLLASSYHWSKPTTTKKTPPAPAPVVVPRTQEVNDGTS